MPRLPTALRGDLLGEVNRDDIARERVLVVDPVGESRRATRKGTNLAPGQRLPLFGRRIVDRLEDQPFALTELAVQRVPLEHLGDDRVTNLAIPLGCLALRSRVLSASSADE